MEQESKVQTVSAILVLRDYRNSNSGNVDGLMAVTLTQGPRSQTVFMLVPGPF